MKYRFSVIGFFVAAGLVVVVWLSVVDRGSEGPSGGVRTHESDAVVGAFDLVGGIDAVPASGGHEEEADSLLADDSAEGDEGAEEEESIIARYARRLIEHSTPENAEWFDAPAEMGVFRGRLVSPTGTAAAYLRTPANGSVGPQGLAIHKFASNEWLEVEPARSAEGGEIMLMEWMPDGKSLLYVERYVREYTREAPDGRPYAPLFDWDVGRLDIASGEAVALATMPVLNFLDIAVDDAGRIFVAHPSIDGGGVVELALIDDRGGLSPVLMLDHDSTIYTSPSSQSVFIVPGREEIWFNSTVLRTPGSFAEGADWFIMRANYHDGSDQVAETYMEDSSLVLWNNAESQFLFYKDKGFWIHDLGTGNSFRVFDDLTITRPLSFTEDGSGILFFGSRTGIIDRAAMREGNMTGLGLFAIPLPDAVVNPAR